MGGIMEHARPPAEDHLRREMRDMGVRGLLVYCTDHRYSYSIAISGDGWPDDLRLSDIEARFLCQARGKRGSDEWLR
jgi:hypothetical protein